MSDLANQTPLLELARSVPKDFRGEWETQWFDDGTPCGHAMAPVGKYLHDMADEIGRLENKVFELLEGKLAATIRDLPEWKKLEAENVCLRAALSEVIESNSWQYEMIQKALAAVAEEKTDE